jgi:hypothetical protein
MPFRFRRSIRIAPGLRLNLSKSGVSASVGGRGAHVTVGHGHTRTTVSAPGTGISYTTTTGRRRRQGGGTFGQRVDRPGGLSGAAMVVRVAQLTTRRHWRSYGQDSLPSAPRPWTRRSAPRAGPAHDDG